MDAAKTKLLNRGAEAQSASHDASKSWRARRLGIDPSGLTTDGGNQ